MQETIDRLFVILKIVERCNLACSYCYFFFGGDESYLKHSPIIKKETIVKLTDFLIQGAKELKVKEIYIYLHGGEPLLKKKQPFDEMCQLLREKLSFVDLRMSVQTNGVLLDKEWIDLFKKHQVSVGVSVDGSKEIHDQYRVDHKGRGSYERTKRGIDLLRNERYHNFGALSVINTAASGRKVYQHLSQELGFDSFDLLLPDLNHDNKPEDLNSKISDFLSDAFKTWAEEGNQNVRVRFFDSIITRLLGRNSGFINFGPHQENIAALTISSDGDLNPDDTLRSTAQNVIQTGKTIYNSSLKQFLDQDIFKLLKKAKTELPGDCQKCVWKNICAGGEPVNRYSSANGFDNPSIYCESLKRIYELATKYLLKNGVAAEEIAKNLAA